MRVYISKYRSHWISPYTILDRIFFWTDWSRCSRWSVEQSLEDEQREQSAYVEHPEWVERWADRLRPVSQAIQWFLDCVHPRIEYVRIDPWDTWSMDHTLGQIALPMLRQLQRTKHGSPMVDDEDVPDHLKSTAAPPRENEWDTDGNHHARWEWVMAEMIFAFENHLDDSWEDAFRSGEIDTVWVPVDRDGNEVPRGQHRHYQMKDGPNHTYQCDYDGMKVVQDRIDNGFRLFGKYFRALWD
jgi:hypothetical protein